MFKINRNQINLPYEIKLEKTKIVINSFFEQFPNEDFAIAFSGGLDSLVLADIVNKIDSSIPKVFANTGNELTEIKKFALSHDNVIQVKPKKFLPEIIKTYGYPVISKTVSVHVDRYFNTKSEEQKQLRKYGGINPTSQRKQAGLSKKWWFLLDAPFRCSEKCCYFLKKEPMKRLKKAYFVGERIEESSLRKLTWEKFGCIIAKSKLCKPLSIWSHKDIKRYIKENNLKYCNLYDKGFIRTGCALCLFNIENDLNRFKILKEIDEKIYNYGLKLGYKEVIDYINSNSKLNIWI